MRRIIKGLAGLPLLWLVACRCVSTDVLEPGQVVVASPPKNKIQWVKERDTMDVTCNRIARY